MFQSFGEQYFFLFVWTSRRLGAVWTGDFTGVFRGFIFCGMCLLRPFAKEVLPRQDSSGVSGGIYSSCAYPAVITWPSSRMLKTDGNFDA